MKIKKRASMVLALILVVALTFSGLTALADVDDVENPECIAENHYTVVDAEDDADIFYDDTDAFDDEAVTDDYETIEDSQTSEETNTDEANLVRTFESNAMAEIEASSSIVTEIGSIRLSSAGYGFPSIEQGSCFEEFKEKISRIDLIFLFDTNNEVVGWLPLHPSMISDLDTTILGDHILTITFQGLTTAAFVRVEAPREPDLLEECPCGDTGEDFFSVWNIPERVLVGITLEQVMSVTSLSFGVNCGACGDIWTSSPLTSDMITGFDSSTPGVRTITINVQGTLITKDIEFIFPADAWMVLPNWTIFIMQGRDSIDDFPRLMGAIQSDEYQWGQSFLITSDMISGFDPDQIGRQDVTVSFLGLTGTFTVEVIASPADTIDPWDPEHILTEEQARDIIADGGTIKGKGGAWAQLFPIFPQGTSLPEFIDAMSCSSYFLFGSDMSTAFWVVNSDDEIIGWLNIPVTPDMVSSFNSSVANVRPAVPGEAGYGYGVYHLIDGYDWFTVTVDFWGIVSHTTRFGIFAEDPGNGGGDPGNGGGDPGNGGGEPNNGGEDPDPEGEDPDPEGEDPDPEGETTSPQTGDSLALMSYILLSISSLLVLSKVAVVKKRFKN